MSVCTPPLRLTWFITRSPASEPPEAPSERAFAMESISSKKRMHGAAARALSNRLRTLASDSPNHIVSSSGPCSGGGGGGGSGGVGMLVEDDSPPPASGLPPSQLSPHCSTLIERKLALHSLAMALARRVFPQPGGP